MAPRLPPECIAEIVPYVGNNLFTLHSCLQLDRTWCMVTVPYLWRDPFTLLHSQFATKKDTGEEILPVPRYNQFSLVEMYLRFLPSETKTTLRQENVKISDSLPLFNYAQYIRRLNLPVMFDA